MIKAGIVLVCLLGVALAADAGNIWVAVLFTLLMLLA